MDATTPHHDLTTPPTALLVPAAVPDTIVIGLCGRAGAGKDTVAALLVEQYGFIQLSFAEPIKAMLEALFAHTGVDDAYLSSRTLREQPIPGWGVSARRMLQTLGTEWGRALHQDFWVHALRDSMHWPRSPIHDRIVISDVRFANEAAFVRETGGYLVRIDRPGACAALDTMVAQHASEQQAKTLMAQLRIANAGSLHDLHDQVAAVCDAIGLDRRGDA